MRDRERENLCFPNPTPPPKNKHLYSLEDLFMLKFPKHLKPNGILYKSNGIEIYQKNIDQVLALCTDSFRFFTDENINSNHDC